MARIPGPDGLGQQQIEVRRTATPGPSDAIQQGAQHLAARMGQIADDSLQRQEEANRLKTAADLSRYEVDLGVMRQRVQDDLVGGKYASREEAQRAFQAEQDAMTSSLYERVPPTLRPAAEMKGNEAMTRQALGFGEFLDRHATSEARSSLGTIQQGIIEQFRTGQLPAPLARQQYQTAIEANGRALRYSPEETAKELEGFGKALQGAAVSERLNEIGKTDSTAMLREEIRRLKDDAYQPELGDRRVQVRDYAESRIRELEAGLRVRKGEWENTMKTQLGQWQALFRSGNAIPPGVQDELSQFERATAGTEIGKAFQFEKKTYQLSRDLALADLPGQQQKVGEAKARAAAAQNPEQAVQLTMQAASLQNLYASNQQRVRANPYQYAAEVHGITVPPLDLSQNLSQQLAQRGAAVAKVKAATGVNPGLLKPEEADALKTSIKALPVQLQGDFFKGLQRTDRETAKATLAQLGTVDPVLMASGMHDLNGHLEIGTRRPVGNLVREGQKLLEDKALTIPGKADKSIELAFKNHYSEALGSDPSAYQAALQQTRAILAFRAKEAGSIDISTSPADVRNAAALAIGQIGEINGQRTLIPYGMRGSEFEVKAPVAIANALQAQGYKPEQVNTLRESVTLEPADFGSYRLKSGRDYVVGKNGQIVTVEIR